MPTKSLRELRLERGLTLEAVSVLAGDGIDVATISRIERGKVQPRPETIVRLARARHRSETNGINHQ